MQTYKKKYAIDVIDQEITYYSTPEDNLLVALERGFSRCIPPGCRCGGCGECKIQIVEGEFESKRMSKAHISEQDAEANIVLACRIFPRSNLKIKTKLCELTSQGDSHC